jgi:ribosomal protein L29
MSVSINWEIFQVGKGGFPASLHISEIKRVIAFVKTMLAESKLEAA